MGTGFKPVPLVTGQAAQAMNDYSREASVHQHRAIAAGHGPGAARRTAWLVPVTLMVALASAWGALADDQARHCARCDAAITEKLQAVVTDFAGEQEHPYCNVACALCDMMDKYPTSRAVAHDPFAGKEVRVIRTGVKWVAWPTTAVFLFLPQADAPNPSAPDADHQGDQGSSQATGVGAQHAVPLSVAQRCLAFPRQNEYIQYLATHPEVAAHNPRPLRLPELLAALKEHPAPKQGQPT